MDSNKRKAEHSEGRDDKRQKAGKTNTRGGKKQWQVPRNNQGAVQAKAIQPGDCGIWATCAKGREVKCVGELRDLFSDYADLLYGSALEVGDDAGEDSKDVDIESEIKAEVEGIQKPSAVQLFTSVRLNMQCVVFFKTVSPIEPVSFVKKMCEDAANDSALKHTKTVKRLCPMTLMGQATEEGLTKTAAQVLAPHFHQQPVSSKKYAIRPNLRNHTTLKRDAVIKQIAAMVGPGHVVDLKNYELLIIVEIYQNICGISVVDDSFERLKRFNLAEIFDPTPKESPQESHTTPDTQSEAATDENLAIAEPDARKALA
ncbi:hypothetical protein LTS10_002270 [Elasticomyces elasticus]|nr:hypothetical protein LTS10_002270 [Elasticomyces elasticus]